MAVKFKVIEKGQRGKERKYYASPVTAISTPTGLTIPMNIGIGFAQLPINLSACETPDSVWILNE
jgi:hypothetical protein